METLTSLLAHIAALTFPPIFNVFSDVLQMHLIQATAQLEFQHEALVGEVDVSTMLDMPLANLAAYATLTLNTMPVILA